MIFKIISRNERVPTSGTNQAYLWRDGWDDWFSFRTTFDLFVFDNAGIRHDVGQLKIGQQGLMPAQVEGPGQRAPNLPETFETLAEHFFSLGQSETYYLALERIPSGLGHEVLRALRDCAFDLNILSGNLHERSMLDSLLRHVRPEIVAHKFNRIIKGYVDLTPFHFRYTFASDNSGVPQPTIEFEIIPSSVPPTNVHVLIGRNGVGKTRCLKNLATAVAQEDADPTTAGSLELLNSDGRTWFFAGLVVVTLSAFDQFEKPHPVRQGMRVEFVVPPEKQFVNEPDDREDTAASHEFEAQYTRMFCESFAMCRVGPKRIRLLEAIATLENDVLFEDARISALLDLPAHNWRSDAARLFDRLSSGHKVVLLTITKLVEVVEENSLVLLDEPEGHLHPPLLSAFVRALSDLLIKRNGVAIISTHSPVVLQEVPSSCVWMLRRTGRESRVERPALQTFGENVGTLTREVFGLEVTGTGFHKMLADAIGDSTQTYDLVAARFGNQIGAEGLAILRSLIASRPAGEGGRL